MAFFKFLFFATLYLLIKIGDIVYSVLRILISIPLLAIKALVKLLGYIFGFSIGITQKVKEKASGNKNTIRLYFAGFLYFSGRFLKSLLLIPLSITLFLYRTFIAAIAEVLNFCLIFLKIITFPFTLLFKRKKKRKYKKKVVIATRVPMLFRFKYLLFGAVFAFFFFFLPATFFIFITDLPKLSALSVNYVPKTTKILDRNGTLLYEIYSSQNRTVVSLNKIPTTLKEATIAIEDKDFYKHNGFDIKAIARAIYVDITKNEIQGGSTITQQLIKSALLTPEPSISRKAKELVLAFWAERKYTKDQILELYFNYVPYGGTAWGVEAASNLYFGKSVSNLSLSESAYLAGLPQSPSTFSPFAGDRSLGKKRQKVVLNAMVENGYITKSEADNAYKEPLSFMHPQAPILAPHFVMYIKDLLIKKYGLFDVERGGLQVKTTLDLPTQKLAEGIVSDEVDKNGYLGVGNGAALVTNPKNGDILAMVGSKDYFDLEHDGNVNVTTSLRQPGSTIKIVTYALALTRGYTEATILDDTPLTINIPGSKPYSPVNYDGKYHGRVPLRIAFANSFNITAVRLAQKLGVEAIVDFGKRMGISSWGPAENYGLSITLGAAEVSMVDLATAYGTIANNGYKAELNPILEIRDPEGKVIEEKSDKSQPVIDPGVAYIISDIISDNKARSIEFGSNSPLNIPNRKISVKTGTTDNKRDNWTIGYTPDILIATWVGNNDNTPLSQALASGITGAAPMWNRLMLSIMSENDTGEREKPDDVIAKPCFGYTAYFILGTDQNTQCKMLPPSPTPQQQ